MNPLLTLIAAVSSVFSVSNGLKPDFDAEASVRYAKLVSQARSLVETGRGNEALAMMKEAKGIYAQDGDLHYRLGQAQLAAKDYSGAIESYTKAIELGAFAPKYRANCLYDIACAHALNGDKAKAFEFVEQAVRAGFRDLQHLRTDSDLESLRTDPRWENLAATKDVSKMSRDEGWRYDLWLLDREMRRIHFNPYRFFTAAELDAYVKDVHARIPQMSDAQVMASFLRYAVMLGDGHTSVRPPPDSPGAFTVPIQLFWYEEGIFVTAAAPEHSDLVGAQILKVDGQPVESFVPTFEKYIWRDNPQGIRVSYPQRLTMPAFGHAVGSFKASDQVTYTVRDPKGVTRDVTLKSGPAGSNAGWLVARKDSKNPDPLYLKNRSKSYYFEPVPELKAVYFQYNAVLSEQDEPLGAFCNRMFKYIDENNIERLIVDVRWNGGGNSFLNRNIHNEIYARPKINRRGSLFVITGRNTFSAAQNFTTDLVRNANPILVGEPTGSSPNFVGETIILNLPYSKARCSISDLYWQRSWPMDHRIWLAPEIPAPPVFALYKDNRDPAMEAIAAYLK